MRSPELTSFFKIFPFFASETFYITIIALGYWLASNPRIFWKLGFLVPFSTMLNVILKNLFLCERPDISLHLVPIVDNSSGFPSGDVHVAAVFWGMLLSNFYSRSLRFFGVAIIVGIMLSRVYLGVHTVDQVFGGLFFGVATVFVAENRYGRYGEKIFDSWQNGKTSTYWLIYALICLAYIMTTKAIQPFMLSISGVLLGYGLAALYVKQYMLSGIRGNFLSVVMGIVSLWFINWVFPKVPFEKVIWADGIFIVKYTLVALTIFAFVPLLLLKSKIFSRSINPSQDRDFGRNSDTS